MMERAMQRMTVESMLKQAGADAESIRQLNRVCRVSKGCVILWELLQPLGSGLPLPAHEGG